MAELVLRQRSALAGWDDRLAAAGARAGGAVALAEAAFLAQVLVRAEPGSPAARAFEAALGGALPGANRVAALPGGREALWLGPDEWLVVALPGETAELEAALAAAAAGEAGGNPAVTSLSANRTAIDVNGRWAHDVLAAVCGLDLHPRAFQPGCCAQTLLASAPVILQEREAAAGGGRSFRVLVRPSLSAYVAEWLVDAVDGVAAEHAAVAAGLR